MKSPQQLTCLCLLLALSMVVASCSGPKELANQDFQRVDVDPEKIITEVPDYRSELQTLKGKGRAIVSEPGNTERVTLLFSSNRKKSLVTIRNGIGIEGGKLLTDGDTLLVYNKVDGYARKIPVRTGDLNHINRLASLNVLDMISYSIPEGKVEAVLENSDTYKLRLTTGTEVYVDKKSHLVQQVVQPKKSGLPYSKIKYEAHASLKGFTLPRRITIFGAEEESKIALQLMSLNLNPKLDSLTINLPDDIRVYYR